MMLFWPWKILLLKRIGEKTANNKNANRKEYSMNQERVNYSIIYDDLTRLCAELDAQGQGLIFELKKALMTDFNIVGAENRFSDLVTIGRLRQISLQLANLTRPIRRSANQFILSPSHLLEAFKMATAGEPEQLHYSFGYHLGDCHISTRLIALKLDSSHMTYAKANLDHSTQVLHEAEQRFGEMLTIYWHAHPGSTSGSNKPSGIDMRTQSRLEKGGYSVIGGIFSRSGHVRFFSDQLEFEVSIVGKGVRKIGENQFQLTQIN